MVIGAQEDIVRCGIVRTAMDIEAAGPEPDTKLPVTVLPL